MLNNELKFKVLDIEKVKDFLFIVLDNGKKILINDTEVYDVSGFDSVIDLFEMNNRFCAVMKNGYSICLLDLKKNVTLFKDFKVEQISKVDDRILCIFKRVGDGTNYLYDIEKEKYLPLPEGYSFEMSLGNDLYVYNEIKSDVGFYNRKRCIININGEIVLDDIEGFVELSDNFIIIKQSDGFCIIKIDTDSLTRSYLKQDKNMLAKPGYYNGNIVIIEEGIVKILKPDFTLVNQFEIEELKSVIDYEIVSDILKLCLSYTKEGEEFSKNLFVNLKTGKTISHLLIEGYPYWVPKVYVGKDSLDDENISFENGKTYKEIEYHFYDSDFNEVVSINGNFYSDIDDENIFIVSTWDGSEIKRQYVNIKNSIIKDCNYSKIRFAQGQTNGYGFNLSNGMMDIIDENLNVVVPNIDYQKLELSENNRLSKDFSYFVVNNYVCIIKRIWDHKSLYRFIIQDKEGKILLDSTECRCYALKDFIQIVHNGTSEFLNTLTGEKGAFYITVSADENGNADFSMIDSLSAIFESSETSKLLVGYSKVKSFVSDIKKDD